MSLLPTRISVATTTVADATVACQTLSYPGGVPPDSAGQQPLPDDLATLWYLIRRVAGLMDRQGEALFRGELGISLAQFLVLSVVDAHPGPLSQQAVADRLGLTKGTVSRQIDAAVDAGLMTVSVAAHTRREH